MNPAPISVDLFGAEMRLTGSGRASEFAWHTKSARVLAFLLCHGNDCDWVDLLAEVWGDATRDARAAYHTLQSTLNKRLNELHSSSENRLAVAGSRATLSVDVRSNSPHLIESISAGTLFSLTKEAEVELRQCDPKLFLASLEGDWANALRRTLIVSHQRLTQPTWDAIVPHASQLHGGQIRQLIDNAKSELIFIVMDANEMILSCERALLAALDRGVAVHFLLFDAEVGVKPADAEWNVMVDQAGLSRCVSGLQAMSEFRKKWKGDSSLLRIQLYPWTPLSRFYIMDGGTADGKLTVVPYMPSRHSPEVPAHCLSWKTAAAVCSEYYGAVKDMLTSPALRDLHVG